MFDSWVQAASGARDAVAVGVWARIENAACARRLSAAADVLDRLHRADGSAERDQWIEDNQTSFNNSLPQPGRHELTTKQKVELFMMVAKRRYEVE